jgi:hypothetical protein
MSGGPYARYFQTAMRVIRRTLITPRPNLRLTRRRYLEDNSAVIVKGVVKLADATVWSPREPERGASQIRGTASLCLFAG